MSISSPDIDFRGARGSNAGDQFHELWALQQVLELLNPETNLKAVGVEGIRAENSQQNVSTHTWEGVDCALYYGGATLETVDKIEFVQLKYSAANPDTAWTIARLTSITAKRKKNSVIRKMGEDYTAAKARIKKGANLKIRFVSNQGLSSDLKNVLASRWSGSLTDSKLDHTIKEDLKRLKKATGLDDSAFRDFIESIDFSECGIYSRFAIKEKVVEIIAGLVGDDVSSEVRELQNMVHDLMLPERVGEIITEKTILLWFGISSCEGLFPCPSDYRIPVHIVNRSAAEEVARLLKKGERLILVHGVGGCGKTTLIHQIADYLPTGSVTVIFDCFGGGRYINSDDKRHLPENAFLHLTNEISITLKLPLFLPRSSKYPANIKTFLGKLRSAGESLRELSPDAILLVIVDAADNSVVAAQAAEPPERPFVFDLFEANLSNLPYNIRIITSCRTARRASLRLPLNTPKVICPTFTLEESRHHLETMLPSPSDSLVEQFHHLSNANPRVQAYAIAEAVNDPSRLLDVLLPGGKSLADVLRQSFDNSLKKIGQFQVYNKLVGALAFLPAPIDVPSISRVTGCSEDTVSDFALDLAPGLRLQVKTVTIADEDFEVFIKDEGSVNRNSIIADIAKDFFTYYLNDPYCSIHVADMLIAAGRAQDVLTVIDRDPFATAIGDPIVRHQVQVRRLKLSLAACREAGSKTDILKTILISAEAARDDSRLTEVLEKELDLSVEFVGASLRRTILLDRERRKEHGSFLAQDAVRAIRAGDCVTAGERLRFYSEWLKHRRMIKENEQLEQWTVSDSDIAARTETICELGGPKSAYKDLMRWKPREIALIVAYILVPQLIAAEKTHHIKKLLKEYPPSGPWDLLLWVPLAMAGEPVDGHAIEKSLRRIRHCFVPDAEAFGMTFDKKDWQEKLLDTFITACELAFKLSLSKQIILGAIENILIVLEGPQKQRLYDSQACRLDGLIRCWILKEALSGRAVKEEVFIQYVRTFDPAIVQEKNKGSKKSRKRTDTNSRHNDEFESLIKKIRGLFTIYSARLDILSFAKNSQQITNEQLHRLCSIESHSYDFDSGHFSVYLRDKAARSVMGLLIIEDVNIFELFKKAITLANGRYSDMFAKHRKKLWERMCLRSTEAENLVLLIAEAVEEIKGLHAASSDKVDAIIGLSRLILPVSRDDAEALFNEAIDIAKDIDYEAFDQIDFVSVLSGHASISEQSVCRTIADHIYSFVSIAAENLSDSEHFPWRAAVHALTCVDKVNALSAICRWADVGTVSLYETLGPFLHTALRRSIISPETSISLALLIDGLPGDLQKELISQTVEDPQKYKGVIEELAKDVLLIPSQQERLSLGREIVNRISQNYCSEGSWLTYLRNTVVFLGQIEDKGEIALSINQDTPLPSINGAIPKEFEFDHKGELFITPESIKEVLLEAKNSGLFYNASVLIKKMRDVSSSPKNRVPFLNSLAEVPSELIWRPVLIELFHDILSAWMNTPAVTDWCKGRLPSLLINHFYGVAIWLKEKPTFLDQLLNYAGLNQEERFKLILEGVATVGDTFDSHTLFAIAEKIVPELNKVESGELLIWYTRRLWKRLPAKDQSLYSSTEVPADATETIARFLFSLMSDIDTRVRWRAAHALRRLAKLGSFDIVAATVLQSIRIRDDYFRNPEAPFYFLAAKLWLTISLYRISAETPKALSQCKTQLFDFATSSELPHVGIREYAKRTLLQLASFDAISLNSLEQEKLNRVNMAQKGIMSETRGMHKSFNRTRSDKCRFDFDSMDTIPYWYEGILNLFPTLSPDLFFEIAEHWILDKWGADPKINMWDKDPRRNRYGERNYELWTHDHGSLPKVERFGTYFEWNAMHCAVGELLNTHPISKADDYYFDSFEYWLEHVLPTIPPYWISDFRGPTPLETRLWKEDSKTDKGWLFNMRREEFLTEIGLSSSTRKGWIIIGASYSAHFSKRETSIRINSALVSPDTASALVRALQTVRKPWDFGIPYEEDGLQIDDPPFSLIGCLAYVHNDVRFDKYDPIRYGVSGTYVKPGRMLSEALNLEQQNGNHRTWIQKDSGKSLFFYETWCDEPPPERDYYIRNICSDGWRLWARSDMVKSFITNGGWDLICRVQIERQLRNEYGRSYEESKQKKTHDKILLLKADGSIADVGGHIGSWTGTSKGTRA